MTSPLIADGRPVLALDIRATGPDDLAYIDKTWHQSVVSGNASAKVDVALDRATTGRSMIEQLLAREDVYSIAAYDDSRHRPIVGWMVWSTGRVPVVHYVYVRGSDRGCGVAMSLLRSPVAALGHRMIYTFRGMKKRGQKADAHLVAALERRGVGAVYVPIREYLGSVQP